MVSTADFHNARILIVDDQEANVQLLEEMLREDPVTAHIPVLAISASAMPLDIKKGLEAGFFCYLTKPIKVNEFMAALNMALEFAGIQSVKSK